MRVIPDVDERDLAAMCRSLLAAELAPDAQWKALADAGLLGLAIDEEFGGSGGRLTDVGIFSVEAGRALSPMIVHGTIHAALAVDALLETDARAALLPGLVSGATKAATALSSARDAADISPALRARRDGDGWRVSGTIDFVVAAADADMIVATADAGGRPMVFAVDTADVDIDPVPLMGGFPAFTVRADDVAVNHGSVVDDAALRRVVNIGVALHNLELVGVGQAVIDRTVEYTTMREQFGRPIASFQAAQHMVADMHIALAAARLTAQSAIFWLGRGRPAVRETAIARMRAAAVKKITLDAHQLHGGMGYVVDTGLHRFSERARVLSTLGGGADIAAAWLEGDMNRDGAR
jgi:alkylation response protein AidB-like acyl-CoA dehydrogenase